jgi:hypothetical protein
MMADSARLLPARGGGFTQRRLCSLLALVLERPVQAGQPRSNTPQVPQPYFASPTLSP